MKQPTMGLNPGPLDYKSGFLTTTPHAYIVGISFYPSTGHVNVWYSLEGTCPCLKKILLHELNTPNQEAKIFIYVSNY